jgi:hypothetical protein
MDMFNIRNQRIAIDASGATDLDGIFVPDGSAANEAFARLGAHSRRFERQAVDYPVEVRLVDREGQEVDRGQAVIRDMTPAGAFIGDLDLATGVIPVTAFNLHFRVVEGDLEGVEGTCRPVRITSGADGGIGVTFRKVYVRILGEDGDEEDAA